MSGQARGSALPPPAVDPEWARNSWRLDAGLGAPVGLLGITYQRRLGEAFAAESGLGWGVSGTQVAGMLRVRGIPILGSPGFGVSLAFAQAPFHPVAERRGTIVWFNAELLNLERRSASGTVYSGGLGLVMPLAGEFSVCRSTCTPDERQSFIYPAIRLGIGKWF
jgi:hypothetical protein